MGLSGVLIEEILKLGRSMIRFCCLNCETKGTLVSSNENVRQVLVLSDMVNRLLITVNVLGHQIAAIVAEIREVKDCFASNKGTTPLPYHPAQIQELVQVETRELHEREKEK